MILGLLTAVFVSSWKEFHSETLSRVALSIWLVAFVAGHKVSLSVKQGWGWKWKKRGSRRELSEMSSSLDRSYCCAVSSCQMYWDDWQKPFVGKVFENSCELGWQTVVREISRRTKTRVWETDKNCARLNQIKLTQDGGSFQIVFEGSPNLSMSFAVAPLSRIHVFLKGCNFRCLLLENFEVLESEEARKPCKKVNHTLLQATIGQLTWACKNLYLKRFLLKHAQRVPAVAKAFSVDSPMTQVIEWNWNHALWRIPIWWTKKCRQDLVRCFCNGTKWRWVSASMARDCSQASSSYSISYQENNRLSIFGYERHVASDISPSLQDHRSSRDPQDALPVI